MPDPLPLFPNLNLSFFPDNGNKEPLSHYFVRVKTITRDPLMVDPDYVIKVRDVKHHRFCVPVANQPPCILFILCRIEGTGAVYQDAILLKGRPDIHKYSFLSSGTKHSVFCRPFLYSHPFAEHSFSRTGSINKYNIEEA